MMTHSLTLETVFEKLRTQGLRMTAQRELILRILDEANSHLDAEGLYLCARERDQSVSLATVYRTVNVLLDAGVIQQRFLDQDHSRGYYELSDEEHYHFACRNCGEVIEFETDLTAQIRKQVSEQYGVEVLHTGLHLEGLCKKCLAQAKEKAS